MSGSYCEQLQARMPDVIAGRDRWSADEARHVATCADCVAVQRLLAATARLGVDVEQGYDAATAAARVTARLRTAPAERPSRTPLGLLTGLAAAAAVAVAVLTWPGPSAPPVPSDQALFLTELDSLTPAELAILADELAPPLSELAEPEPATLLDLDSIQLERVLRSLEG